MTRRLYVLEDLRAGEWSAFHHNARWTRNEARKLRRQNLREAEPGRKIRIAIYERRGVSR